MRPRNAQITENIVTESGNVYPRVSEATIQSIARIPDGHSLISVVFMVRWRVKDDNKMPILGDIPILNFFFKSKQTLKEKSSLVFVVTPTSYNPSCIKSNNKASERLRQSTAEASRKSVSKASFGNPIEARFTTDITSGMTL